jgi:hypothetical protein
MGGLVRKVLVLSIALAFVASGTAWRSCMAMHLTPPDAPAHASHGQDAPDQHAHDHGHHASHDQQVADEPAHSSVDDHACMKCCIACAIASVLPTGTDGAAIFTVSAAIFSCGYSDRIGRTILIDPGIPKRIA